MTSDIKQNPLSRRHFLGAAGAAGAGSAASWRRISLTSLTSRKTTEATMKNWITVLMKAPYWIATFSIASVAGSSGRSTHSSFEKSSPPVSRPMGGMIT